MPVLDVENKFSAHLLGTALHRLWNIRDRRLGPALDAHGVEAQCPITLEPFTDPVLLSDGFVYERTAATEWMQTHETSPCTNERLRHKTAWRLLPIREAIDRFLFLCSSEEQPSASDALKQAAQRCNDVHLMDVREILDVQRAVRQGIDLVTEEVHGLQTLLSTSRRIEEELRHYVHRVSAVRLQSVLRTRIAQRIVIAASEQEESLKGRSMSQLQCKFRAFRAQQLLRQRMFGMAKDTICSMFQSFTAKRHLEQLREERHSVLSQQLWVACKLGNDQLVRLFLEAGADTNVEYIREKTRWWNHTVTGEMLDRDISIFLMSHVGTPLIAASAAGHDAVVRSLCAFRADVNQEVEGDSSPDDSSLTALCTAAHCGHVGVTSLLLKASADIYGESLFGQALNYAARQGHVEIAENLCHANADPSGYYMDGEPPGESCMPLSSAAQHDHIKFMAFLLSCRANVNSMDVNGGTPLFEAAGEGRVNAASALLDANADINVGSNSLHNGVQASHLSIVRLLLRRRADVDTVDTSFCGKPGKTPLSLVVSLRFQYPDLDQHGSIDIMKLLICAKADTAPAWGEVKNPTPRCDLSANSAAGSTSPQNRVAMCMRRCLTLGEISRSIMSFSDDDGNECVLRALYQTFEKFCLST